MGRPMPLYWGSPANTVKTVKILVEAGIDPPPGMVLAVVELAECALDNATTPVRDFERTMRALNVVAEVDAELASGRRPMEVYADRAAGSNDDPERVGRMIRRARDRIAAKRTEST